MSTFIIDWDGIDPVSVYSGGAADDVNIYGTTTLNDGLGGTSVVTVSAPANYVATASSPIVAGVDVGNYFYLSNNALGSPTPDGTLTTANTEGPVQTSIMFDSAVTDISFEILDIDQSLTGAGLAGVPWDDQVTIYAVDAAGIPILSTIAVNNTVIGQHSVTQNVAVTGAGTTSNVGVQINSTGSTNPGVDGFGAGDSVSISILGTSGPAVHGIVIVYTNGPTTTASGVIGIGPISYNDPTPSCFVRGTMIETDRGEIAIEDLAADDLVRTMDNGFQPIRWIGSTTVKAKGHKAPILFRAGTIGNVLDLMLSPAHRVVLQGWQSELLFGDSELLASAQSLVNDSTIVRQEGGEVEYFHILFDRHEIVFSNGAATESFHPGQVASGAMAQEARDEIFSLFPELEHNKASYGPAVRGTLKAHEVALLSM